MKRNLTVLDFFIAGLIIFAGFMVIFFASTLIKPPSTQAMTVTEELITQATIVEYDNGTSFISFDHDGIHYVVQFEGEYDGT